MEWEFLGAAFNGGQFWNTGFFFFFLIIIIMGVKRSIAFY
jgi:hypothetical protein